LFTATSDIAVDKTGSLLKRGTLIMAKRILIAEDEKSAREALANLATKRGYDVTTVTNGVDLLAIAAHVRFDLIITDLLMEDLNGASAIEIMKMQGHTTPTIALTGVSVQDTCNIKDSFNRIFYKPVNIKDLFECIETLIGNRVS
jgi:CheY-like chemotaxis protein